MTKLQGKELAAVVAEVLTEAEAAERAKAKAEVKHVVEVIQGDLKREKRNQQDHLDAATKATERMKKLQERLKAIKAGDQGALKTPDSVGYDVRWERLYELRGFDPGYRGPAYRRCF